MKTLKDYTSDELLKELQSRGYIRHIWHKDDVLEQARRDGIKLTEDQTNSIMKDLENTDCEYGINWQTISDLIYLKKV